MKRTLPRLAAVALLLAAALTAPAAVADAPARPASLFGPEVTAEVCDAPRTPAVAGEEEPLPRSTVGCSIMCPGSVRLGIDPYLQECPSSVTSCTKYKDENGLYCAIDCHGYGAYLCFPDGC